MFRKPNKKKGFTLVEILICVGLFVMLIGLVFSTMSFFRRTFVRSSNSGWNSQQAESFLLKINNDIKQISSIAKPAPGETGTSLSFNTIDGNEINYELAEGGNLIRKQKNQKRVLENVESINFSRNAFNVIGVEITLGKKGQKKFKLVTSLFAWNIQR
ncbi:MAG: PulJ/GspJ family protein [Candidatus Rifleibacteriota bacterium]